LDTILALDDRLPLTCTRSGACCHDKAITINPWELACLAREKGCTPREFRDRFTSHGGTRIRVDGPAPSTCSQLGPDERCTVHAGRPLACRLYPLGRRREKSVVHYLHRGTVFPCLLDGCPQVRDLPQLTLADYLAGQGVAAGEAAQDAYVEVTLNLAEAALVLLLEGGPAASGDRETLGRWRKLGAMPDAERAARLPGDWFDLLTVPGLDDVLDDPLEFARRHDELLEAQSAIKDCCLTMAASIHLGRSAGMAAKDLAEQWIAVAKQHGAKE